jgi:hypothetical protein
VTPKVRNREEKMELEGRDVTTLTVSPEREVAMLGSGARPGEAWSIGLRRCSHHTWQMGL